jgi:hypothetical protein
MRLVPPSLSVSRGKVVRVGIGGEAFAPRPDIVTNGVARTFASHSDLDRRIRLLEVWKERIGHDPLVTVRERFGLKAK